LIDPVEGSGLRGSSASVGERPSLTACSTQRRPKRQRVAPVDLESAKRDQLLQMLLEKHAREDENKKMYSKENLTDLISNITKGIWAQLQPQPVQSLSPSPSTSLMLLESPPDPGSVRSSSLQCPLSLEPSLNTTTSENPTPGSAPQQAEDRVQPIQEVAEPGRPEGDGSEDRAGCSPSPSSPGVQLESS
jgi:hypothetical protein